MFINPESPSKQVARISFDVGAVTNQRVPGYFQARIPIQWEAVWVLPDPRPANMSNVSYSPPSGSCWWGSACMAHLICQMAASNCGLGQC